MKTAQKMVDEAAMELPGIYTRFKTVKGRRVFDGKFYMDRYPFLRGVLEEGESYKIKSSAPVTYDNSGNIIPLKVIILDGQDNLLLQFTSI